MSIVQEAEKFTPALSGDLVFNKEDKDLSMESFLFDHNQFKRGILNLQKVLPLF